jgi:protein gp37
MRIAERFRGTPAFPSGFDVVLRWDRLDVPLHWRRPRKIFVNSMSDLFHDDVPVDFIHAVFETMRRAHWHEF